VNTEIVLAHDIRVHCGHSNFEWNAISHFISDLKDSKSNHEFEENQRHRPVVPVTESMCWKLTSMRTRYQSRNDAPTLKVLLLALLLDSLDSKCQDPRDKIYGIFGLFNDTQNLSLQVDYTKSMREVLHDVIIILAY